MLGNFRLLFFCAMCFSSESRNTAIARMDNMERKRKEWKLDGKKGWGLGYPVIFLFCKVNILSLTWITGLLLPATKALLST